MKIRNKHQKYCSFIARIFAVKMEGTIYKSSYLIVGLELSFIDDYLQ